MVNAGRWVADGVDEVRGLDKFKVVADDTSVTEAIWKDVADYDTSGCPEWYAVIEAEAARRAIAVKADADKADAEKAAAVKAAEKAAADAEAAKDGAAYLAAGAVMAAATALAF